MKDIPFEYLLTIGKVLAGALVVLIPLGIKWIKQRAYKSHFTVRKMDSAAIINSRIIEMRANLTVDRVGIFEYSNGEKTVAGFPFLYATMTYEKVADNIASIKEQYNKVPASWFSSLNGHLVDTKVQYAVFYSDGTAIIDGVEIQTPDAASILIGYKIVTNALFKITTDIGDGLIAISDHSRKIEFSEAEISQIKGDINYLSHIMSQRPK